MKTLFGDSRTQHQHAAAAYVLNEVRAYVLAESQPDLPTPSHAQCTITEAGLGQLRNLGGRCTERINRNYTCCVSCYEMNVK